MGASHPYDGEPLTLRPLEPGDVPALFRHQDDHEASRMAAFPSRSRAEHDAVWSKVLADPDIRACAILLGERVAGHVVAFPAEGRRLVGYWIGREDWGRGVASAALARFLALERARPLHAVVAAHNAASIRVLEKSGFALEGDAPTPEEEDVRLLLYVLRR